MNLYEFVSSIVRNNVLLIFGKVGAGKTTFCMELARSVPDKRVLYIDTELGVEEEDLPENVDYIAVPKLSELKKVIKKAEAYDIIVIDSIGLLIYGSLGGKTLKERSEIFLGRGEIMFKLRVLAKLSEKLVILTTQPDYFEGKGKDLEGAKYLHFAKEIWQFKLTYSNPDKTMIDVYTYRSRKYGKDKKLFRMYISREGVRVEFS